MQESTTITDVDIAVEELEALVAPGSGRGAAEVAAGLTVVILVAAVLC